MNNGVLIGLLMVIFAAGWRHFGPLDASAIVALVYIFTRERINW